MWILDIRPSIVFKYIILYISIQYDVLYVYVYIIDLKPCYFGFDRFISNTDVDRYLSL